MQYEFFMPTKILFGRGQLSNLHKEKPAGTKALIVMSGGTSAKKYGYLDKLEKELQLSGVAYSIFAKVIPNPTREEVMEAAAQAKAEQCDFIIGLGGGSSIDTAKAVAIMAVNDGDLWDYMSGGSGKEKPFENKPLPIVAITTTAGTGTEADQWFVITKSETNEKIGAGFPSTFPVLSIVDADLMLSVPPQFTAFQGFDALFHSVEGYINKAASPLSDMFALKAIELLGAYLPRAVFDGQNITAREHVALANTLSGFVETLSGCISEHSLEHALSAFHPELVHGKGLIILSEAYYSYFIAKGVCADKFMIMAKALGASNVTKPQDFLTALINLQKACNVYGMKLSDYGITKADLPRYADNAVTTCGAMFEGDPYRLTHDDIIGILVQAYK